MSKALEFLSHARPDAMGHYFSFLKAAGQRLDPRTRNLISVITKVHAQTERGLRQYASRAVREGSSAEEIVDALLMAFPALGLTRVLWAIDVLLEMGLIEPGAHAEGAPQADEQPPAAEMRWHPAVSVARLGSDTTLRLDVGGIPLLVHAQGDEFIAFDARCPHQGTLIAPADRRDEQFVCPKHQWTFDASSGACKGPGQQPLRRYPTRVVDAQVQVLLPLAG